MGGYWGSLPPEGGVSRPRGDLDAGLTQVKAAVGSLAPINNDYRTWTIQYFDGQVYMSLQMQMWWTPGEYV